MSQEQFTITQAAESIGISRPTLYRYLAQPKYKPKMVAGHPVLSAGQVAAIKAERKNGKK